MLQRVGLAQALINDPEVLFLDEPMSDLDPLGRREARELIASLRARGKTVFFSSHILSDVEQISDRVAIVVGGKIQDVGRPRDLVGNVRLATEVVLHVTGESAAVAAATQEIGARAEKVRGDGGDLLAVLAAGADVDDFLEFARARGGKVISVTPRHETLEDLFLRRVEASKAERAAKAS
jgi:ABC-2 type transport system ATP-binding protein